MNENTWQNRIIGHGEANPADFLTFLHAESDGRGVEIGPAPTVEPIGRTA